MSEQAKSRIAIVTGAGTGIRYAIGSRVRVQVSRVDLDGRKIDFRLVREGEELTSRALKDKGLPGTTGVPVKAADKRSGRRKNEASRSAQSPIQALRSAVKKATSKIKGKGRATRR